jgi:predicted ATP-grasp superfamily ATP-dependent carboligase
MFDAARVPLVVIAVSGRALAQSAVRGGWRVRVLDAFADRDTREMGEAVCVTRDNAIALHPARMFAALGKPTERIIVTGSGFERTPQLLHRLAGHGTLCANDADIVTALKEPELAAELLQALGFCVPQTQRSPPADAHGWLQKEIGGAGGVHVRSATGAAHRLRYYYQRLVAGRPMSVTFLADGERAYLLGFNEQSICAVGGAPYCYAGAATCAVAPALKNRMQAQLDRLVRVTGLRGLNGLDFMLDGERVWALEVNPRPTASFELYDADIAGGLVNWHVRSFSSQVREFSRELDRRSGKARAYRILFAEDELRVPEVFEFPEWCRDVPNARSAIATCAPVLSVFADGETPELAQAQLTQRTLDMRQMLARWKVDARADCAV